ncbi:MAG: type IV pilus assembly protein PilM [Bacteriovoracaceae bacterium]
MLSFGGGGSLIGLDIGSSAVKVVELAKKGKKGFKLNKFGMVALPEGAIVEDEIIKDEEVVEAIKEALSAAKISSKNICLGLYGPNTLTRRLQIEGGTEEEMEDQVEWESEQYLPFSIDEAKLDYYVVGENDGGGQDVIIAASKEEVYESYLDLLKPLKLKPKVVDLNVIAVTNVFSHILGDRIDESVDSYMILDIGAQSTKFIIYRAGVIAFAKEIAVGGMMFTEEIQRQMGVNYLEAEDLKIVADDQGNLPEEVLVIISQVLEVVVGELHKTLDFYITSSSDDSIVACYITGGAVRTPGLMEKIEEVFGFQVELINPFETIAINEKAFDEDEIDEIAHIGLASIGLGMRSP